MPRITFTSNWPWKPNRGTTMTFKAGNEYLVTEACARAAKEAGVVEEPRAGKAAARTKKED